MPSIPTKPALDNALNVLLECDFWIDSLAPNEFYSRLHDDNDGEDKPEHTLQVFVAEDSDVHLSIPHAFDSLRFRSYLGGGASPRVRNALMVLAEAIRRDNKERPQHFTTQGQ